MSIYHWSVYTYLAWASKLFRIHRCCRICPIESMDVWSGVNAKIYCTTWGLLLITMYCVLLIIFQLFFLRKTLNLYATTFLFSPVEVGIMIYIVDGCCEIWVCELSQHRVWNLGASCRLDLHAYYKNEIFVSHWPARCNKVRVNRKKKNRWQRNIRWNLCPVKENYLELRIKNRWD